MKHKLYIFRASVVLLMLFLTAGMLSAQTVNTQITAQTDTFTATFDVVPSTAPMNGGVGFSKDTVNAWNQMSTILGFRSGGVIDARNGGGYEALQTLKYEAGKTYHVVMTVDVPSKLYSVKVTPEDGLPVVIAKDFAFRVDVDTLNNFFSHNDSIIAWGGVHGATLDVSNFQILTEPVAIDYQPTINVPVTPRADTFTVSFDITPSDAPMNAGVGFSKGAVASWGQMSTIVGFRSGGIIDVRDGTAYKALEVMKYEAGVTYHVIMTIDVAHNMYSVQVTPDGGSPVILAKDFAFRVSVDTLNNFFTHNDTLEAWGGVHGAQLICEHFNIADTVMTIDNSITVGTAINTPIPGQTGRFVAEFDAVASDDSINGGLAFSEHLAGAWGQLSTIVRFTPMGKIDVRNGNMYESLSDYKYYKGRTYHFNMYVDILSQTYNVTVTGDDHVTVKLAENYAFRIPADTLNYRVVMIDTNQAWGGKPGSMIDVTNFMIHGTYARANIYPADTPPVIDGDLSDGFWDNYEAHNINVKQPWPNAPWYGPVDFSAYWKAAWDADSLYLMVDVNDSILYNGGAPAWNHDAFDVYFGILNNRNGLGGGDPKDSSKFMFNVLWPDVPGGNGTWNKSYKWVDRQDGKGYVAEFAFAWNDLNANGYNIDFTAGTQFLFDIHLVDDDNPAWDDMSIWAWSSPANCWANMDMAGEVTLANALNTTDLLHAIDSAAGILDTATVGNGIGEYTQDKVDALTGALDTASTFHVNIAPATTQDEVDQATQDLLDAIAAFTPNVTGIKVVKTATFTVYPNPVHGTLTISDLENNVIMVEIVNMTGATVKQIMVKGRNNVTVNVSDLTNGIYILKVISGSQITTKLVIKK